VIVPSYTFVSTANAFVLRRARPVFVDVRPDTLNIDERLIEQAITPRTRAYSPYTMRASPARWIRSWLPMYFDLTDREVEEVASTVLDSYRTRHAR
jgi:hypothetical protein